MDVLYEVLKHPTRVDFAGCIDAVFTGRQPASGGALYDIDFMEFHFDPRDLIGPPFRECPKCGKTAFGSLSISSESQTRRCRECFFTKADPLWPLQKKVIYVDQFAISNMMKALDITARGHDRAKADPFWLALFEALERVCKLQLAICPDSEQHHEASIVSPFFSALKRMYEQLSHGVTFYDTERIAQEQLHVAKNRHTTSRRRGSPEGNCMRGRID